MPENAIQRTWDLQIPCSCSRPVHCERFHGLPLPSAEFHALLPGVQARTEERSKLYAAYDVAKTGDQRKLAFSALTHPHNGYY